ncbi:DUF2971 domain-containing protein [Sinorhizobium meliloti]|uniref:DUF2971 domain-containing protein n=1 Tax=Rhizobium meliloti TaxID=382 RepID=UPI0013E3E027|nr:DUF2971 domain-containing protein [Sinorhizobium meliloti]
MNLVEEHLAREPAFSDVIPDQKLLFHYTSFAGFLGIVGTQSMWASCIHYLNDSREFKHGLDVAKDVAEQKLKDGKEKGARRQLLERFIPALEQYSRGYIYIASFTENGDLLSQWRGYAASGGLSLGFDFGVLRLIAAQNENGFRLIQCIYDNERKRRLASAIIDDALIRVPEDADLEYGRIEKTAYGLVLSYFQLAAAFKDSSFAEESEWRFISRYVKADNANVKVRATPRLLIPYYELPLDIGRTRQHGNSKARKDIGLEVIVIGPSAEQQLISSAVDVVTYGQGVWVTQQRRSQIPYRTL